METAVGNRKPVFVRFFHTKVNITLSNSHSPRTKVYSVCVRVREWMGVLRLHSLEIYDIIDTNDRLRRRSDSYLSENHSLTISQPSCIEMDCDEISRFDPSLQFLFVNFEKVSGGKHKIWYFVYLPTRRSIAVFVICQS